MDLLISHDDWAVNCFNRSWKSIESGNKISKLKLEKKAKLIL